MTKLLEPDLGDLVLIHWRDSFCHHGQKELASIDDDTRWGSVGWVVRKNEHFITIAPGVCLTGDEDGNLDNPLSVLRAQILGIRKVL